MTASNRWFEIHSICNGNVLFEVRESGQFVHCVERIFICNYKEISCFFRHPSSGSYMDVKMCICFCVCTMNGSFFLLLFLCVCGSNDLCVSICRNLKRLPCTLLLFLPISLEIKESVTFCTHKYVCVAFFFSCVHFSKARLSDVYMYVSCAKEENVHTLRNSIHACHIRCTCV